MHPVWSCLPFATVIVAVNLVIPSESLAEGRRYEVPPVVIDWKGDSDKNIQEYQERLGDYLKKSCTAQFREEYTALSAKYRSAGLFIPMLGSGKVDKQSIRANLSLITQRLRWIEGLKKNFPSSKTIAQFEPAARQLQSRVNQLLEYKKDYHLQKNRNQKRQALNHSKRDLKKLSEEFVQMTKKIPFLLSFKYPVDHFEHRFRHESLKRKKKMQQANQLFVQRQILEDGAQDADGSNPDIYLRTTLDTIALQLKKQKDFLGEELRFDLEWALGMVRKSLSRGSATQQERLAEWQQRTKQELEFYNKIVLERNPAQEMELVEGKASATKMLRDFILRHHAKTYAFWAKESELFEALFSFDQILLNEAGRATSENYSDRRDIAQVVVNRRYHTFYSQMDQDEPLFDYLKASGVDDKDLKLHRWLNVLMKDEQFSFTLYFIPAVEYVFCPDISPLARSARKENLKLALEVLKHPQTRFRATRYFSRFSMIGKIDMGPMWEGFAPVPQSPGRKLTLTSDLSQAIEKKQFRYLYDFKTADNEKYHVAEIDNRTYVFSSLDPKAEVYEYRSPHKFTFYEEP